MSNLRPTTLVLALAAATAPVPAAAQATSNPGMLLEAGRIVTDGILPIAAGDHFGWAMSYLGDLDGDGRRELAVGAPRDDSAGTNAGAVWILTLDDDSSILESQRIVLPSELGTGDLFGHALANLGDVDGDEIPELAVGAPGDDTGGTNRGAFYILHLQTDGTLASYEKIAYQTGGFQGALDNEDDFGFALAGLGDLDGDLVPDVVIGAPGDQDENPPSNDTGALYVLFLDSSGQVRAEQKVSNVVGGLSNVLDAGDRFGCALSNLGDRDGDGRNEIAVGALGLEEPGFPVNSGAVWILCLDDDGTLDAKSLISASSLSLQGALSGSDGFGLSVEGIGDIDRDGTPDLAVGVERESFLLSGAIWVLLLDPLGLPKSAQRLTSPELGANVEGSDGFGRGMASLGLAYLNAVRNGDLEEGPSSSDWLQASTNFGTPLCGPGCNLVGGSGPRSGDWCLRFGGVAGGRELSSVQQALVLPSDLLTLYLHNPISSGKSGPLADVFSVAIDGMTVFSVVEGDPAYASGYVQVEIDVSEFNDGNLHVLRLAGDTSGFVNLTMPARTDFLVDDILLVETPRVGPFGLFAGAPRDDAAGADAGAVWNLALEGPLAATSAIRNAGTNPLAYTSLTDPVIGQNWTAAINRTDGTKAWSRTSILGFERPFPGLTTVFGQLLVDLTSSELFISTVIAAVNPPPPPVLQHSLAVPNDVSLLGFTLSTQGLRYIGSNVTSELLNAIDLTIGF